MQLLVIRHGIALDLSEAGRPKMRDDERPLTDEGRAKMTEGAKGLHALVPEVAILAASPLVRARQTAEIVAARYGITEILTCPDLRPESRPEAFVAWAADHPTGDVMAIVGHEPNLSTLVAWFMSGSQDAHVEMKKGGAALLEFARAPRRGDGILRWLAPPKVLRRFE